jgi:hypothetical protein
MSQRLLGSVLVRRHLNAQFFFSSIATSTCLFVLSIVLCSARTNQLSLEPSDDITQAMGPRPLFNGTGNPEILFRELSGGDTTQSDFLELVDSMDSSLAAVVPPQSMTVILPIISGTLHNTQYLLAPFLHPLERIREVIVICPDAIALDVRRRLQKTFASQGSPDHPDISLRPWQGHLDINIAVLRSSIDSTSDWVLIMDESGLTDLSQPTRDALLNPPCVTLPFGPKGVAHSSIYRSNAFNLGRAQPAHSLRPPFVVPLSLMVSVYNDMTGITLDPWLDLAKRISRHERNDEIGGILILVDTTVEKEFYSSAELGDIPTPTVHALPLPDWKPNLPTSQPIFIPSRFIFLLPTREDLRSVAPLICKMKFTHKRVRIRLLIYDELYDKATLTLDWETEFFETYRCSIKYNILTGRVPLSFAKSGSSLLSQWLNSEPALVDVVFTLSERDHLVSFLDVHFKTLFSEATHIRVPRLDLSNTEWMSSLTLIEWKSTDIHTRNSIVPC